jgi:hypothetical protein
MFLDCLNDYIGGGSHYWTLQCPACLTVYYYDTYRFMLQRDPDPVAVGFESGAVTLADFAALLP